VKPRSESAAPVDLVQSCVGALRRNLGLGENERVLIVTDAEKIGIGRAFEEAARRIAGSVELLEVPLAHRNGQEPPADAGRRMLDADVVLAPTSHSLSWTLARRNATEAGARFASMPTITEETILRTLGIDYEPVRERANRLCDLLDAGSKVHVVTASGTDLRLDVVDREAHGRKGGIYLEPGHWGNLPCGEAFVAPVEGTAEGVYVVDASQAGVGAVAEPIRVVVANGRAVSIEGGEEAHTLAAVLEAVGDPAAYAIAELGIGCNHAARVTGITLEDEKVLGTCHIALGSNDLFGGTVRVDSHLDGVIRDPEIRIDGALVDPA
jgi:leucyl aminopeptidase (aminopeptidase T)